MTNCLHSQPNWGEFLLSSPKSWWFKCPIDDLSNAVGPRLLNVFCNILIFICACTTSLSWKILGHVTADNYTTFRAHVCAHYVTSVMSDSLRPHGLQPARLFCPWNSPGKNSGVDCYGLQGIFSTQEWNLSLLHLLYWQAGSLALVPLGSLHDLGNTDFSTPLWL